MVKNKIVITGGAGFVGTNLIKLLLKKTGWNVVAEEKFTNPVSKIGFRPILRLFTYRYLLIYAERKSFK